MITSKSRAATIDFISNNEKYQEYLAKTPRAKTLRNEENESNQEIKKYYSLNQTGNILISSTVDTEEDLAEDIKEVFQKAIVFFGAWTKALSTKNRSIHDMDAVEKLIERSGFFVDLDKIKNLIIVLQWGNSIQQ